MNNINDLLVELDSLRAEVEQIKADWRAATAKNRELLQSIKAMEMARGIEKQETGYEITALRAQLDALSRQEPVAWRFRCPDGYNLSDEADEGGEPLYTHPAAVPDED